MDYDTAMKRLRAAGTAQNQKVYTRHGVTGPMFGVSFAAQKSLAKAAGRDSSLAERLWESGNHDARILATFVADPGQTTARTLSNWVKDVDSYVLGDALSKLAAEAGVATAVVEKWCASASEWVGQVGWNVVAQRAMYDPAADEAWLASRLDDIRKTIHARKNRTRYAMNGALIAIGLRGGDLGRRALEVAQTVGVVEVDHGETGCKTPLAADYIRKAVTSGRAGVRPRPASAAGQGGAAKKQAPKRATAGAKPKAPARRSATSRSASARRK